MSTLDVVLDCDAGDELLSRVTLEEAWWSTRHLPRHHGFWGTHLRGRFGSLKTVMRLLVERATGSRKRAAIDAAFMDHWESFYVTQMARTDVMDHGTGREQVQRAMVAALATGIAITWNRLPALVHAVERARTRNEVSEAIQVLKGQLLDGTFDELFDGELDTAELDDIHDDVTNHSNLHAHSAPLEAWVDRPR